MKDKLQSDPHLLQMCLVRWVILTYVPYNHWWKAGFVSVGLHTCEIRKKNLSQLVCQAHLQVFLKKKKKKHCYPVITRHKEVTAIAVGVKFTDRCAYCKSRPDYLVLMTKHKKKKPKTSNDITFISMKWSISLPGIPQSLKACFHRERQVLVRGQGGSVGCIELAHS